MGRCKLNKIYCIRNLKILNLDNIFYFGLGPRLADYQQDGVGSAHPRQILYTTLKNKNTCQTTIKGKLHKKYLWKNENMEKLHPPPS